MHIESPSVSRSSGAAGKACGDATRRAAPGSTLEAPGHRDGDGRVGLTFRNEAKRRVAVQCFLRLKGTLLGLKSFLGRLEGFGNVG